MRQVKGIVCLGLLCLFLGIATSPALGDDDKNQANWDRLKQLSPGEEIQVVQNGAKSSRSNFRSVTDEAIVVSTAAGEQAIARQSILRVSSKGKGHRVRNALIGAGVGAGAGLGIGAATDHHIACTGICVNILPNLGEEIVPPLGAIVGAVIGAVVPTGGWHVIYRAR